jgi:NYN domain
VHGAHSFDKDGTLLPTFVPGQPDDRQARSRVWKLEEKKTDVNLAMAMYRDAAKGRYSQLVLCSNDSDAEPALQALREDFAQLKIGVVTPVPPPSPSKGNPRGVSTSLAQHAHWVRRYLLDGELANAQLSQLVPTHKRPVRKPIHW